MVSNGSRGKDSALPYSFVPFVVFPLRRQNLVQEMGKSPTRLGESGSYDYHIVYYCADFLWTMSQAVLELQLGYVTVWRACCQSTCIRASRRRIKMLKLLKPERRFCLLGQVPVT